MFDLRVDEGRLDEIRGQMQATPGQAQVALQRAIRRVAQQTRTAGTRALQRRLSTRNQRALRSRWRLYFRRTPDGEGRRIWAGANPLAATAFVSQSQAERQQQRRATSDVRPHNRRGASVRGHQRRYQAGVTVRGDTDDAGFWIRVQGRWIDVRREGGWSRVETDISEETADVVRTEFDNLPERLYERFEQELANVVRQSG